MKAYFLTILLFFLTNISFSQLLSPFSIMGKTNILKDGKAVLINRNSPDTVNIINYKFKFEGLLKEAEPCRIILLSNESNDLTELFFIDTGFQQIMIDSSIQIHDYLDFGVGVTLKGSKINDEYFKTYLSLFINVYKARNKYYSERDECDLIKNEERKKACIVKSEVKKYKLRETRDSILLNYAILHPQSRIISRLIGDAVFYYGYNNLYEQAFEMVKGYIPQSRMEHLDSTLKQNKLKAVGNVFPLANYINAHFSKSYLKGNKYTLVDFWFAKCRPCIGQFNLLKDVYGKNKQKGFDIVAISIDKASAIQDYERVIRENNYSWNQILDTGGIKTNLIHIKKFPLNFLLDKAGKIIAVDINPFVLDDFLKKNL